VQLARLVHVYGALQLEANEYSGYAVASLAGATSTSKQFMLETEEEEEDW